MTPVLIVKASLRKCVPLFEVPHARREVGGLRLRREPEHHLRAAEELVHEDLHELPRRHSRGQGSSPVAQGTQEGRCGDGVRVRGLAVVGLHHIAEPGPPIREGKKLTLGTRLSAPFFTMDCHFLRSQCCL